MAASYRVAKLQDASLCPAPAQNDGGRLKAEIGSTQDYDRARKIFATSDCCSSRYRHGYCAAEFLVSMMRRVSICQ